MLAGPPGGADPGPAAAADAAVLAVLAALELVAVAAVVGIWRERGRTVLARMLWTAVTLVPVLGLIADAVGRDPPAPSDPIDRPPERWDA